MKKRKITILDSLSERVTTALGTPQSIIIHTAFFCSIFLLMFFGWDIGQVLLLLTTLLSVEAIYLALFIQMTVNKASESLEDVEEDIDEIEKDIDTIQEDVQEDDITDAEFSRVLERIEKRLDILQRNVQNLQK
ncbi:MAG: hypothetical protein NUV52_03455 [Candidatus Roizmanbacteria bacterium]|nr:hypothetical protein [Candidatus Roizmanbacteria bacterium]